MQWALRAGLKRRSLAGMKETAGKITLWGVEVFVATAEERSVTAAARRLRTSAATISQQLSKLEAVAGTMLVDRSSRPLTLTPAGEMFQRRANAILNEADQARMELARASLSGLTRLRLGMIEDFDADVTPALLSGLTGSLKRCQFLLETGASHRLIEHLESRALDVIVAADPAADPGQFETHRILQEPFVAVAPPSWTPAELKDRPFISYTQRHVMGRQVKEHLVRNDVHLQGRLELDSYHAILAMVAEEAGWTIMTPLGWLRAQRFRGRVAVHPLPFAPLGREISLIARKDVLGGMPADIALRLRDLVDELIVGPTIKAEPWLKGKLTLA